MRPKPLPAAPLLNNMDHNSSEAWDLLFIKAFSLKTSRTSFDKLMIRAGT
jgi:hypothetical protein